MKLRIFTSSILVGTIFVSAAAFAQNQAPTLAPPPPPPGATGPEAPVGKVTETLEARLKAMTQGQNGLTSDEVVRRTLSHNAQIIAKRRNIEAIDASVAETRAAFYPQLTLSARYTRLSPIEPPVLPGGAGGGAIAVTPISGPQGRPIPDSEQLYAYSPPPTRLPVYLNNYTLQATLNVPLSDYVLRTSSAIAGAKRAKSAAEFEEKAVRLSVARDARVAYYQWIRTQGAAFVALQALEQAKGHLADAQAAFQVGLVSRADVLRAESGLKSAELFAERTRNGVDNATQALRVLMHDTSSSNYEVGENVLVDLPPGAGNIDPNIAYSEALQKRLEMRALGETEEALREQARVARAGNYPRLDAQANAIYANPNTRYFPLEDKFQATWDASLVLSWTPTNIFGAQASATKAEAQAAEIAAQREGLRDALRLEVHQALTAAREAEFTLSSTRQALTAAEEGYRVRRELFRNGKATLVEVTDAETELTRARLEVVDAHINLRIARVQLAHALGRDVTATK